MSRPLGYVGLKLRVCKVLLGIVLPSCGDPDQTETVTTTSNVGSDTATLSGSSSALSEDSSSGDFTHTSDSSASSEEHERWLQAPVVAEDLDPHPSKALFNLLVGAAQAPIAGVDRDVLAYNSVVPGPTLRMRLGDEVTIRYHNAMEVPTTIHWHGVDVPWTMDGATFMRSPVAPRETFEVRFVANRAGTFWYHPHVDSERQLDRGLYGALIVDDPNEPAHLQDLLLVADVWDEVVHTDGGDTHLRTNGKRQGDQHGQGIWLINGHEQGRKVAVAPGVPVRLRAINVSNSGYLALQWPAMRQIASDQGLLPQVEQPESVLLTPGDRGEFEIMVGEVPVNVVALPYTMFGPAGHGDPQVLLTLVPSSPGPAPAPTVWPMQMRMPSSLPAQPDVVYVLEGDHLLETWKINGEKFPDVTIRSFARDRDTFIEVRNLSSTEHPFHTHGHPFEVLSRDGVQPPAFSLEDTINVPIHGRALLRLHATEPGIWMAHCHIMSHSHHMATLYEVK